MEIKALITIFKKLNLFQALVLYFLELSRFITFGSITIIINIYYVPKVFFINLLAEMY